MRSDKGQPQEVPEKWVYLRPSDLSDLKKRIIDRCRMSLSWATRGGKFTRDKVRKKGLLGQEVKETYCFWAFLVDDLL